MSDLISRQEAIDVLMQLHDAHKADQYTGDLLHWTGIKAMLECIPSAEPERKKGEWIDTIGGFYCSICGDAWSEDRRKEMNEVNYCPNCGARME